MRKIKSPHRLLQEKYWPDGWKILVCCMMLNLTGRRQVDKVIDEFFRRWPDALECGNADPREMEELLTPLGLQSRRSYNLIQMSKDYTGKDWERPKELHGIGQYAQDAWDLFIEGKIPDEVKDHALVKYAAWARETWKDNSDK